jgi:hypothetical protein
MALELAAALDVAEHLLPTRTIFMSLMGTLGRWQDAERMWRLIEPMDRKVPRGRSRPGDAEFRYIGKVLLPQERIHEWAIVNAEQLAAADSNRSTLRQLQLVRGLWRLRRGEPGEAATAFREAVRMANEAGFADYASETYLALARLRAEPATTADAAEAAGRLSVVAAPEHQALAELWQELGDTTRATMHAQAAYRWAWADGEPYVRRFELTQAAATLRALGAPTPAIPKQRRAPHPIERWLGPAAEVIARVRAQKR